MLLNIGIAVFMLVVATAFHAVGMVLALHAIQKYEGESSKHPRLSRIYRVSGIILLMFLASIMEVLVWASTFLALNAIQGLEKALYFSMVTFTSLGYGEIVLDERWRLLASSEAGNGIIMFGWTTAIVIASVQRIYHSEKS